MKIASLNILFSNYLIILTTGVFLITVHVSNNSYWFKY